MYQKKCSQCGNVIKQRDASGRRRSDKEYRERIFCSRECSSASQRLTPGARSCEHCGGMMPPKKFESVRAYAKRKFCNQSCHHSSHSGKNSPLYRGGFSISDGYKHINMLGKDSTRVHRYVAEHIIIMEEHIGRALCDGEVVHHVNEDRLDNRLENLELMTRSQHAKHHDHERERTVRGTFA